MKIYKVLTANDPEDAERQMNQMASQGWCVKAVAHWETAMARRLATTFEKDA